VDDPALSKLVNDTFPIVLLGRLPGVKVSSVEFDNRSSARAAVDHLVAQGYTRIGVIGYAPITFTGAEERISGYRDSLAAHRIAFDETLIRYAAYSGESGFAATLSLLESGPAPTALFVTSDEIALGALAALQSLLELGKLDAKYYAGPHHTIG
jgi:LacI family transcriptional regulator